ncbi:MAG: DUF4139 domain-containing protein [Treponema sp.]|jgi:hypothetical protein|nr:DUF4139 domain-containing protein [Treponema sp.]
MKNTHKALFLALSFAAASSPLYPQNAPGGERSGASRTVEPGSGGALSLRKISLFSSGVGYFEHSGAVPPSAEIDLPFDLEAVNDALKSLVINDPLPGASPSVSYPSEESLERSLQSLRIDLSKNPGTAEIFAGQRGAEIEVFAPASIRGRIVGVEYRMASGAGGEPAMEAYLSLHTGEVLRVIALKDIASFSFTDPALNGDLKRALDLIAANRVSNTRNLKILLPGNGGRVVSLSYVIPVPVWKVSYRLDLGGKEPLLQGWAIIDNNSDTDWDGVELSLVSGRPVSFIQNLYPPYYLERPTLPLSIAGSAQARSHAPGYGRDALAAPSLEYLNADANVYPGEAAPERLSAKSFAADAPPPSPVGPVNAAAAGRAAADQFAYTVKNPVTLPRRRSSMIPLTEGRVEAVKYLILQGSGALNQTIHPELGAEITNTTEMKLPAGPITVFDGGSYAGDALVEFFGGGEKRLITYGEDLSVSATASSGTDRFFSSVSASGGVMTIVRRLSHQRTYTVKNASEEAKRLIIEHGITSGAALTEPVSFLEKTDRVYRFLQDLPAGGEISFTVKEEIPLSERVVLGGLSLNALIAYSSGGELPPAARAALAGAVELRQGADAAGQALAEKESLRQRLIAEQDRVRNNLAAVGPSTEPGRDYLKRMTAMDGEIDGVNGEIGEAERLAREARRRFEEYIASLSF